MTFIKVFHSVVNVIYLSLILFVIEKLSFNNVVIGISCRNIAVSMVFVTFTTVPVKIAKVQ